MKLPVDVASMTFMAVAPAEPVLDFETKQPRADENGQRLYSAGIVALHDGDGEILQIKVAGDPGKFAQGTPLKVTGLKAQPWTMGDRSGVSYRADKIEPVNAGSSRS